jgi:antitoxin MazE
MGNSSGIIIPKLMLEEVGIKTGDAVEVVIQDGRIVINSVQSLPRLGWDEDAKLIAETGDDALVLGDFGNDGDDEWTW